ncbi:MAG: hypothetical protein JNM88_13940 [Chitinophagaceae bacterium]|nr:hypothetical protein [Chitinophagaceae bacterium]
MPAILFYFIKVAISLSVVFLFYYFILRKLTFYNHNRWYLLGYTLLSLFIPFINISPVLQKNDWEQSLAVKWLPVFGGGNATGAVAEEGSRLTAWDVLLIIIVIGMIIMFCRLVLQFVSFHRMRRNAKLIQAGGMNLYQVDEPIIPFSFGHSIFINSRQHTEQELQEIISHEFVHVKQLHSIDIIWGELLCLLNWYNPFAWLLRHSIRQNLEFIADNKVLEKGVNRKQYQYLLLKVIGNNQYSIASKFNFSSLKKRIAMMNKLKSTRKQLLRLLFLLPATAVLLLAFRSRWTANEKQQSNNTVAVAGLVVDAVTMEPINNASIFIKEKNMTVTTDKNGYYLAEIPFENKPLSFTMLVSKKGYSSFHQTENWGNFTEADIYRRYGKSIELFGLSPSGIENRSFSTLAGNGAGMEALSYENVLKRLRSLQEEDMDADEEQYREESIADTIPLAPAMKGENMTKDFLKRNPDVKRVGWVFSKEDDAVRMVIIRNDGTTEEYNLDNEDELRKAEAKYGKLPVAPPPPPPPPHAEVREVPLPPDAPAPVAEVTVKGRPLRPVPPGTIKEVVVEGVPVAPAPPEPKKLPGNVKSITISNKRVTVILKDGKQEQYDLDKPGQLDAFEKKYGKVIPATPPAPSRRSSAGRNIPGQQPVISGGPTPVYVVDGKEVKPAEVNAISPQTIASVNVLKGDKAIAVYGTKGANGVVEINTRKEVMLTSQKVIVNDAQAAVAGGSPEVIAYSPDLDISVKKLVILDGKEVPQGQNNLKGKFKLVTLDSEQGRKKYGEKGKNGVVELTTVK